MHCHFAGLSRSSVQLPFSDALRRRLAVLSSARVMYNGMATLAALVTHDHDRRTTKGHYITLARYYVVVLCPSAFSNNI